MVRVDRCPQWLTEQVPTINAMTACGNNLLPPSALAADARNQGRIRVFPNDVVAQ